MRGETVISDYRGGSAEKDIRSTRGSEVSLPDYKRPATVHLNASPTLSNPLLPSHYTNSNLWQKRWDMNDSFPFFTSSSLLPNSSSKRKEE